MNFFPELLQESITELVEKYKPHLLKKAFERLSQNYREDKSSLALFQEEIYCLAYLIARMPATFAASSHVLEKFPFPLKKWIDFGAGPGSFSWAAFEKFPEANEAILIEKSLPILKMGQKMAEKHPILSKSTWVLGDKVDSFEKIDALIFSYSFTELEKPLSWIDWWWEKKIPYLLIIEPGTPSRFQALRKVREKILSLGASLIAPCPHLLSCPIEKNDWCHFSVRLPRTKLQRYLKEASFGYEDEKYSYLIASTLPQIELDPARILRHPQKQNQRISLTLCHEGKISQKSIHKKEEEIYRIAKKSEWGDSWKFPI